MQEFDFSNISENVLSIPAIISSDILSYEEYFYCIQQTAKNLSKYSFEKGDRVALLLDKNISFPIVLMALIQIGVIVVPLNQQLPDNQLIKMINLINCSKVMVSDDFNSNQMSSKFQVFEINKLINNKLILPETSALDSIPFSQESTIVFTSGSSGNPKAVLHTLGNHYFSALGSNENISFGPGDRWLLSLPLYHVGGLLILFRAAISGGAVVVPDENWELIENIEKYNITHVSLVATQLLRLLENEASLNILRNLKSILIGGSYIPSELIKNSIKNNLPIFTTYGSTEMASQITTTKSNEKSEKLYTAGKPLNYRTIKISEDGEILVKGETLFKGYVENKRIDSPFDIDGWFHTGDLGKIDNEGYLTVIGRKDNMFISGGENIYPEEIEQILTNIDEIENALVIDVPNKEFGARLIAFVKYHSNKKLNKQNIKKYLSGNLPKFKIPDAFFVWPKSYKSFKPNRSDFKNYYSNSKPKEIM